MKKRLEAIRQGLRTAIALGSYGNNPIRSLKYLPSATNDDRYSLTYSPSDPQASLPIPPQNLWLGYGSTVTEYIESGKKDVDKMISILAESGLLFAENDRPVLDLGCGGGRMIRHLQPYALQKEIWGLDISAPHINWLKTHLSPPFHFAVNTTIPHLPFSDGYFGIICCGSLFTHIDDLAETWFLEARRVLEPGGILFCTLHDEHTLEVLSRQPFHPIVRVISGSLLSNESETKPDILVCGKDSDSNVFYQSRYLKHMLSKLFDVKKIVPSAYGYQTAWVLSKR